MKKYKNIIFASIIFLISLFVFLLSFYRFELSPVSTSNEDKVITVESGSTVNSIAKMLKKNNLIRSKNAFKIYVKLNNKNNLKEGTYKLIEIMSNKKIILLSASLLLGIIVMVGVTYAYWRITYQATSVNKIVSSCFSMELTNEKNNITLEDAYPISDEKGKSLTPYSFTITNTCDLFASYTINLEMLSGTTLDSKYVKTMINSEAIANLNNLETTDTSIEGATESRVLFKGSLGAGDSTDYTLRIWMDSDTPFNEDSMNKVFQSKITVTAEVSTYSPVENGFTNLAEALLVNEYQTTSIDVAKNKIASKQEVDFTKTAPIIEWQPITSNNTQTITSTKVDSSEVGNYNITTNATKIVFAKSYSFNSSTGYYTLGDTEYYDPASVDYTQTDYYFCGSSITSTTNNTVSYSDITTC